MDVPYILLHKLNLKIMYYMVNVNTYKMLINLYSDEAVKIIVINKRTLTFI